MKRPASRNSGFSGSDLAAYIVIAFATFEGISSNLVIAFFLLSESVASRFCPGTALIAIPCTTVSNHMGIALGILLVVGAFLTPVFALKTMVTKRKSSAYALAAGIFLSAVALVLKFGVVIFEPLILYLIAILAVNRKFFLERKPSDDLLIKDPKVRKTNRIINIVACSVFIIVGLLICGLWGYSFLTGDQSADRETVISLKQIVAEKEQEAKDFGAISESSYYNNQPLEFDVLATDSFRVCAVFYTDARGKGGTDIDAHGKGKQCFTRKVSFGDYYTKTARVDKNAYIDSVNSTAIYAEGSNGETVYINIDGRVEFFNSKGSKIQPQDIKVANTIDVYWKITQEEGQPFYAYKVVLTDAGINPKFCAQAISVNGANPQCPETYLELKVVDSGLSEPDRFLGAINKNGVQIDVYWVGGPPVVVNKSGATISVAEMKAGQVFDVVWDGDRPAKLVIK